METARRSACEQAHPGSVRRPEWIFPLATDMVERLKSLQARGTAQAVAVGGVMGAKHYYRDLDITAPPSPGSERVRR